MSTTGRRKCRCCGVWFKPEARNRYHQRYCREPLCRQASKKTSQRKWSRQNPGYFRGEAHVNRVRQWRAQHPGYWKKEALERHTGPPDALQDILTAQGFDNKAVTTLRNCLLEEISRPLQDVLSAQGHALVGLTAMISGELLQDDIARVLRTCYERGQHIGGIVPWINKQEVSDDEKRTVIAETAATHSEALQLG